ncbi:MAG TPA: hypothetical protein VE733_29955 [Streptosporangiaceae bacterium]|nr:hypothetical protein [Streptosporangiaceae bacterium]
MRVRTGWTASPKQSCCRNTTGASAGRTDLALELSPDKTLITHARTERARFLGYDLLAQHSDTKITRRRRAAAAPRCRA